nr:hypothetical protein Iba_chr12bCG1600 [Ipomoea batatas]
MQLSPQPAVFVVQTLAVLLQEVAIHLSLLQFSPVNEEVLELSIMSPLRSFECDGKERSKETPKPLVFFVGDYTSFLVNKLLSLPLSSRSSNFLAPGTSISESFLSVLRAGLQQLNQIRHTLIHLLNLPAILRNTHQARNGLRCNFSCAVRFRLEQFDQKRDASCFAYHGFRLGGGADFAYS